MFVQKTDTKYDDFSKLPIIESLTKVYRLWHCYLRNLHRLSRFTLGARIDNLFLNLIELTLYAGYANREKNSPQFKKPAQSSTP